jgi:hypothetical protein
MRAVNFMYEINDVMKHGLNMADCCYLPSVEYLHLVVQMDLGLYIAYKSR